MAIVVKREPISRTLAIELNVLLLDHHDEVGEEGDLDIDWIAFEVMQESGAYHSFTIRKDNQLIGYAGYLVYPDVRHKGRITSINDLIYIKPKYRGMFYASKLMKFAENELRLLDVYNINQSVKINHDFGLILERQGYQLEDKCYSKRIN